MKTNLPTVLRHSKKRQEQRKSYKAKRLELATGKILQDYVNWKIKYNKLTYTQYKMNN